MSLLCVSAFCHIGEIPLPRSLTRYARPRPAASVTGFLSYMFKIFLNAAVRYSIFQSFRCMNFFKKVVYVAYVSILMLCET